MKKIICEDSLVLIKGLLMAIKIARTMAMTIAMLLVLSCGSESAKPPQDEFGLVLPDKPEMTTFKRLDDIKVFTRGSIWNYFGQSADLYLYNGFQKLAVSRYSSATDRSHKFVAEVMQYNNPTRALAIYSHFRSSNSKHLELPATGAFWGDTLLFLKGTYVGRIIGDFSKPEEDLTAFAKLAVAKINDTDSLPAQLSLLPREGMIPFTETVNLDDLQGQGIHSNLFGAKYIINDDTLTLAFRLNSYEVLNTAVGEFLGKEGTIKEYILDAGYQSLIGESKEGRPSYCALNQGVFVAVSDFNDKQSAKTLIERLFASVLKK